MAAGKIIRKVVFGLTAALLVAIPAVGTPIYKQNEAAIKGFLLTNNVAVSDEEKTASKASGDALAKQALADGMVLLKNENNAIQRLRMPGRRNAADSRVELDVNESFKPGYSDDQVMLLEVSQIQYLQILA